MSQSMVNDENFDPLNAAWGPLTPRSSLRSRPNTSMTPTLRRGNHHHRSLSPLKSRPNTANHPFSKKSVQYSRQTAAECLQMTPKPKYRISRTSSAPTSKRIPFRILTQVPDAQLEKICYRTKDSKAEVVLIGDSKCGKTSLVLSYLGKENRSNRDDNVNLFENYQIPIFIRDYQKTVRMQIWDYPGDEMFDRFRPISYITANFVVICFNFANTDSETSLNNIKERWVPEVVAHCGLNVVKFIIGIDRLKGQAKATKTGSALPNFSYFREVARGLDCKYLECSLSDLRSVERVFDKLATLKLKQEHEGLFKDYKEKGQHAGNKLNTMGNTLYFNYLTADNGPTSESSKVTGAIGYRKTSYRRKRHACLIM